MSQRSLPEFHPRGGGAARPASERHPLATTPRSLPQRPGLSAPGGLSVGLTLIAALIFGGQPATAQTASQPAPRAGTDPTLNVDPMSLLPDPRNRETPRVPIFYPPTPPPLDAPVAHGVVPPGRLAAPPELAMFVNETFYPALSTRLFANNLSDRLRQELGEYHFAKQSLQKALRSELARQRDADPAVRLRALEALARTQTPKIAELEQTAERLRRALVTVSYSWTILREWHLRYQEERGYSPLEIAKVMRGYSHYHGDLLLRQRYLLHEIGIELLAAVDDPAKARAAQPHFFFSPEPARVLLPPHLPAELSAKIAAYQGMKSQLKKELYDAIWAYDGAAVGFWYNPIKTLARRQAARFDELDRLAEEVRHGLAALEIPAPTLERPPLPPVIAARISSLLQDRAAAQREATLRADAVVDRTYEVRVRVAYRFDDDGLKYIVVPGLGRRGPLTKDEERFYAKVQADLAVVADAYGHRLAALLNEEEAIRRDTAELIGPDDRSALEHALDATHRVAVMEASQSAYLDYRAAVFEPGLSPAQRRLLFDGAVEQLDLPLPRGEMQITSRNRKW